MEDNALKHHGVKGQKWGVRRYRKNDGSLTSSGRKRNARLLAIANAHSRWINNDIDDLNQLRDTRGAKTIVKRQIKNLNRYAKETEALKNILIKDLSEKDIVRGQKYVEKIERYGNDKKAYKWMKKYAQEFDTISKKGYAYYQD